MEDFSWKFKRNALGDNGKTKDRMRGTLDELRGTRDGLRDMWDGFRNGSRRRWRTLRRL